MSAGWVAACVRARAMTRRRLGQVRSRELAACGSAAEAIAALAQTTYDHDVHPGQSLAQAQRAVVDTLVWNVRVLAGWVPREGVSGLRVLLAGLEAANVTDHLLRLEGATVPPPYRLGGLATTWPRLAATTNADELRHGLGTSVWGDPGTTSPHQVGVTLLLVAADRVMAGVPCAAAWAAGGAALVTAREVVRGDRELAPRARATAARVLGVAAGSAGTLTQLRDGLRPTAAWALADVTDVPDLWQAEARWWARVDHDGAALARLNRAGPEVVAGTMAMLAADAWQVRAALEVAARGGGPLEAFDAVA